MVPQDLARRIAQRSRPSASDVVHRDIKNGSPSIQQKIQESVNRAILIVDRKHPGTSRISSGKGVKLTSKQFWLLEALAENPGKCVPYDARYTIRIWGGDVMPSNCSRLSYHKAQLLKKIQNRVAPKSDDQIVDHAGLRRGHGSEYAAGRNQQRTRLEPLCCICSTASLHRFLRIGSWKTVVAQDVFLGVKWIAK